MHTESYRPEVRLTSPAEDLLKNYSAVAPKERKDIVDHARRVLSITEAFAGDILPDCGSVVYFHDVVSRFNNTGNKYPESQEAAAVVLTNYLSSPGITSDEMMYIASVLSDFDKIEEAASEHRRDMAETVASDGGARRIDSEVVKMIADSYRGDIPPEVWGLAEAQLDCDHIRRFLKEVNLESVIIKACELLDNLRNPTSTRESALLQDVLEAESFYAPICEVIGMEGLASTLLDQAKIIRLNKQGKPELIEDAKTKLNAIGRIGTRQILKDALGKSEEYFAMLRAVGIDKTIGKTPVNVGEIAIQKKDGSLMSGNYRVKSVGSCAVKLERYGGEWPMDMVGIMIISKDKEQSIRDFADFLEDRLTAPDKEPGRCKMIVKEARSKKSPIYIQGTRDYVNQVTKQLEAIGLSGDLVETKVQEDPQKDGYEKMKVSKVTFIMKYSDPEDPKESIEVPVEVQFLTEDERRRSRLGEIAHIAYKYIDTRIKAENFQGMTEAQIKKRKQELDQWAKATRENFKEVLEDIYHRKKRIDPKNYKINGQSKKGGEELLQRLANQEYRS